MNKKIIALLPMKGHSERVPNKNMKDFHGKPLYHSIVRRLLSSKYIVYVAINTDSDIIKEDARFNFGDRIIIINRPEEICGDFVSMNNIIDHDINTLKDYNHFLQTHSTNPLLKVETINNAIEKYFKGIETNEYDSLFTVTRFQTRFYWKDGAPVNHNLNELKRTQDLPIMYEENSNLYIFSRDSFKQNNNKRIGVKPYLFEMDKIEATDIDEPEDFIIAKKLYKDG